MAKEFNISNPALAFITPQTQQTHETHETQQTHETHKTKRFNAKFKVENYKHLSLVSKLHDMTMTEYLDSLLEADRIKREQEIAAVKEIIRKEI